MQGLPNIMSMQFIVDSEEISKNILQLMIMYLKHQTPNEIFLIHMNFTFMTEKTESTDWKQGIPAITLMLFFAGL